jgi:hypothetical protein
MFINYKKLRSPCHLDVTAVAGETVSLQVDKL